jgi:hypothetical protein
MSVRLNAMRIDGQADAFEDESVMPDLIPCEDEDTDHANHTDWRNWSCKKCGQNTPRYGENLSEIHWLQLPRCWIECSICDAYIPDERSTSPFVVTTDASTAACSPPVSEDTARSASASSNNTWTCDGCGSHTPRVVAQLAGDLDQWHMRPRISIVCTTCKLVHPIVSNGNAEGSNIVRINSMSTDDAYEFDDYFSESYEDDYWNSPSTSPVEEDDDVLEYVDDITQVPSIDTIETPEERELELERVPYDEYRHISLDLTSVPAGWMPYRLLLSLSDESRAELFSSRKLHEDPAWVPSVTPPGDSAHGNVPEILISLGYTSSDEFGDSLWLERLAERQPNRFQEITGYRIPLRYPCEECHKCNPVIWETVHCNIKNGTERTETSLVCCDAIWAGNTPPRLVIDRVDSQSTLLNEIADAVSRVGISSQSEAEATSDLSDDEPPPLVFYSASFGLHDSPLTHMALNTPLPAEPEETDNAIRQSTRNSEATQTNEGSYENDSEYSDNENDRNTTVSPIDPEPRREERLHAAQIIHSSNVRRRSMSVGSQPLRTPRLQATLVAEVEINGVKAFTLFDSGSTTDSITPEFAFATRAKQITLEDQVILQLGCVGSRSKICYGTRVPVDICGVKEEVYFDLVNLDKYDCIIGTPFMNTHGVCLDFGNRAVVVKGVTYPALTLDEEMLFLRNKKETSHSKKQSRLPPRETKPISTRRKEDSPSD